jgi:hypothetical protein
MDDRGMTDKFKRFLDDWEGGSRLAGGSVVPLPPETDGEGRGNTRRRVCARTVSFESTDGPA